MINPIKLSQPWEPIKKDRSSVISKKYHYWYKKNDISSYYIYYYYLSPVSSILLTLEFENKINPLVNYFLWHNSFFSENSSLISITWIPLFLLRIILIKRISQLLNLKMNKINFSDEYFLLTNNTISLLFMWILWNKSGSKCLHTLHNG